MPITFSNIAGAEPSTVTFRVGTVVVARGSSNEHQEILCIGDPQSSVGIAVVKAAAPASTEFALVVRVAGGPSSAADAAFAVQPVAGSTFATRPIQSSAADLQVTATPAGGSTFNTRPIQSSAADLQVTATQSAAAWNIGTVTTVTTITSLSSLSTGHVTVDTGSIRVVQSSASELQATVTPASGSTWPTRPIQSSQADLRITAYQSTATDFLATVTIGQNLQSTAMPSSGSSGLIVRQVVDALTTFASTSALATTSVEIASSGANVRIYVTAYSITCTNQTPTQWGFFSSNGTLLWPIMLAALSSATCGANLAASAPSYLFRTTASDALNFKSAGSTSAGVQLGVSYFKAL